MNVLYLCSYLHPFTGEGEHLTYTPRDQWPADGRLGAGEGELLTYTPRDQWPADGRLGAGEGELLTYTPRDQWPADGVWSRGWGGRTIDIHTTRPMAG